MSTPNTGSRSELETLTTAELVQDAGARVEFEGFGTFGVRRRGLRIDRDSEAGAKAMVVASRVPYFKPGGKLTIRVDDLADELGDEAFRRTSVGLTWPPP